MSTLRFFGRSKQLLQNKFCDPSTPSMRKGLDGGNGEKKMKTFSVATNFVASQLPERRLLVPINISLLAVHMIIDEMLEIMNALQRLHFV